LRESASRGIPAHRIGTVGGGALILPGGNAISVAELKAANEAWLPGYMAQS
jgi:phosphoribosylformylglycinamidine synthase subunit PurL